MGEGEKKMLVILYGERSWVKVDIFVPLHGVQDG